MPTVRLEQGVLDTAAELLCQRERQTVSREDTGTSNERRGRQKWLVRAEAAEQAGGWEQEGVAGSAAASPYDVSGACCAHSRDHVTEAVSGNRSHPAHEVSHCFRRGGRLREDPC